MEKLKVFISWSGEISGAIAKCFKELLPDVFDPHIELFISKNIEKGKRGKDTILKELENTNFGLICLTKESLKSPWVNFEAGALAKTGDGNLWTFLLGINQQDLNGSPLEDYQSTSYLRGKEDIQKLLEAINKQSPFPLKDETLKSRFKIFWQELETKIKPLQASLNNNVIIVLEEQGLNISTEINQIKSTFSNLNLHTAVLEDLRTINLSNISPNLIIYVYNQSHQSHSNLNTMINYIKSQTEDTKTSLIIYCLDNKKLNDDEYESAKSYKLANLPASLIDRCKEILK